MNTVTDTILATLGKPWVVTVDSPIGQKNSPLVFSADEAGQLSGSMTDLFGKKLPLDDIEVSGNTLSWRLNITRPVSVSLLFSATWDGRTLAGTVVSKYPEMAFHGTAPARD